jgi:predicted ATPase/class 3 adenylate cyclase
MPEMPPSGTVTFFFSDVEGSTKLWEREPQTMRIALEQHDVLLRNAIVESGGYVFKTVGDAFCAAFATAQDAVVAALSSQRALSLESWPTSTPIRVRIAVHTGAVNTRDGDYFGPAVNRVARLLSTAHGGQSVLSQTSYDLARDFLPVDTSLIDLGEHALKDLGRPERIFQLLHPDLLREFPPLRSLNDASLKHNLPQQLTSFVGRERESSELQSLILKNRLCTLTGPGGNGKTRLSLQVAADLIDEFEDGAWFVELASLTESVHLVRAVAAVLGLHEDPNKPFLQNLADQLRAKQVLLVLDNCEHLLDACAQLADTLLRQCPRVRILATSRETLSIAGEQIFRVPTLSLPDPRVVQTVSTISHYESVRLFIERALLSNSDFHVTNQSAPALASLCNRLDGVPLALELAAARVRSLSVEEIDGKLDQRFRLLTGGSRTAMPRQQTLRALIDWSYDLLNDSERAMLRRLSVFAGGCTLGPVEVVCSGQGIEDWETLDLLTSLVDKNLISADERNGVTRYGFLETVSRYAQDRLFESGELETWKGRHLSYHVQLAIKAELELSRENLRPWLEFCDTELDNVRAALEWSLDPRGSLDEGLTLAGSVGYYLVFRGLIHEACAILPAFLKARPPTSNPVPAHGNVLLYSGIAALRHGDASTAESMLLHATEIFLAFSDRLGLAHALRALASVSYEFADFETSTSRNLESLGIYRELDFQSGIGYCTNSLGAGASYLKDFATASFYLEESEAIQRRAANAIGLVLPLLNLASIDFEFKRYDSALPRLTEAMSICVSNMDRRLCGACLDAIARLGAETGDFLRAATLWAAGSKLRESAGIPLSPSDRLKHDGQIDRARAASDPKAFDLAWQAGLEMSLEEAEKFALSPYG